MEDMSYEILDAIKEFADNYETLSYKEEEYKKDILFYLYHILTDEKERKKSRLVNMISNWFEENDYCINCGSKLQSYEWSETHNELDGSPKEYFSCDVCLNCDKFSNYERSGY